VTVKLSRRDEAAILTLDRPDALNALSYAIIREIGSAIDTVAKSDARMLIVTGAGAKAFCAGADIGELRGRPMVEEMAGSVLGQTTFARLDTLAIPSIALINGFAFGGGLELAMACTFRLAVATAKMGLPEIKLGLIPGYGGTQRLPRLVGEARALEMIMTGRTVLADEALRVGLVNRIVEGDAMDAAIAFSREITQFSLPVLKLARAAVTRAAELSLTEGLKAEAELSTLAFQLDDSEEGISAFLEKRKAKFKDA
jgi:enoyl-CoA hydratase